MTSRRGRHWVSATLSEGLTTSGDAGGGLTRDSDEGAGEAEGSPQPHPGKQRHPSINPEHHNPRIILLLMGVHPVISITTQKNVIHDLRQVPSADPEAGHQISMSIFLVSKQGQKRPCRVI